LTNPLHCGKLKNMDDNSPLLCDRCNLTPYDTTDKDESGNISLVCFSCKDEILTDRNSPLESWSDEDAELVEEGIEEALRNDTPYCVGVN